MSTIDCPERIACDDFFSNTPEPSNSKEVASKLDEFLLTFNDGGDRENLKIAFVTSGGTSAPLEKPPMAVRFLDNFSSGTRGAALAEYFSKEGYAVVSLRRTGSKEPFFRRCKRLFAKVEASMSMDFLSMFDENKDDAAVVTVEQNRIEMTEFLKSVQADRRAANTQHGFLSIEFTTVYEYLHYLRLISEKLNERRKQVIIVHAAAVSDFYVPWNELPTHKIQSNALEMSGNLFANFSSTPKMLRMCRDIWAPEAFCVSFKLETDQSIIEKKTLAAMRKYNMHCIVANELNKRYDEVILFQRRNCEDREAVAIDTLRIQRDKDEDDIEKQLVKELRRRHEFHINNRVEN